MNLQQMKYVLFTAQYGSISKAARALYVTQPNLSNAIKDLEEELGISIFERKKNGVLLTKQGAELLSSIQPVIQQVTEIEEKYKKKDDYEIMLSVACQHSSIVCDILCKMLEKYKEVSYNVQYLEVRTREVLEYVEKGLCDIGIILKQKENKILDFEMEKRKLDFTVLATVKPHVFIQDNHPLADREIITKEDLAPYPYVKYFQGLDDNRFFTEDLIDNSDAKQVITITDKMSNRSFNRYIHSYSLGSGIKAEKSSSSGVVTIPYDSDEEIEIGYVVVKDRLLSPICQEFIKTTVDMFEQLKL